MTRMIQNDLIARHVHGSERWIYDLSGSLELMGKIYDLSGSLDTVEGLDL